MGDNRVRQVGLMGNTHGQNNYGDAYKGRGKKAGTASRREEKEGQKAQKNKERARFIMIIPTEQQHMASSR